MTDKSFFDTNILVYSRDASEPKKQHIAFDLLKEAWESGTGCLSTQVLNEYYVTVTQKLRPGMLKTEAFEDLQLFEAWKPISIDMKCLHIAFDAQNNYQLSWRDSLIVAAAFLSEAKVIFSEDLNHGQLYFGIEVQNPFYKL